MPASSASAIHSGTAVSSNACGDQTHAAASTTAASASSSRPPSAARTATPAAPASHHHRLRLQPDPEPLVHAGLDGAGQRDDFAAGGAAAVHQNQRLLLVHAGVAHRLALPA